MFILLRIPWFSLPTSFQHDIVYFVHHTITGLEELSYASTPSSRKHALEIPKGLKNETRLTGKRRDTLASSLHMASNRVLAWGNLATTWAESLRDFCLRFLSPDENGKVTSYNWCVIDRTEEKRQKKKEKQKDTP